MIQLITTKGRKSCETIDAAAAWLEEMQPSSVRIAHGDIECEVECPDGAGTIATELRWALRLEEAFRLNLTVENDNIYLTSTSAPLVTVRVGSEGVELRDDQAMVTRRLFDGETLADVLAAVRAEGGRAADDACKDSEHEDE